MSVQKREAVAQLVQVSGKDSVAFWKIYDDYQKVNKKTALQRIKLYERTALAYSTLYQFGLGGGLVVKIR